MLLQECSDSATFMNKTIRKSKNARRNKRASHDSANPPKLIEFMMKNWKPSSKKLPAKVKGYARYLARRKKLSRAFPGCVVIVPSGREKIRANDTTWRFRPGSDFYFLTGNTEPNSVLVLLPRDGRTAHEHVLFVEPNFGRTDPAFFTDRANGELWVGPRSGVYESRHRYHVDRCEPLSQLPDLLKALKRNKKQPIFAAHGLDAVVDSHVKTPTKNRGDVLAFLAEMRLFKDDMEIAAIKRACASTRLAFEDVVRSLRTAGSEREVEGAFNSRARIEGKDVGFGTIVAAGEHACILHWTNNDGRLRKQDMILIDAGVESNEIYTADVTRTLPIGGKFSAVQRQLYDLVIAAQDAAFAAIKPGAHFMDPHWASVRVLTKGLERLGILPMSAQEALKEEHQFFKRYTLHNTSHMLGLDVHDCSNAKPELYREGKLKPGMILTVEPGLYFQKDDLTVPPKYRGIGIRVEDDVLVTTRGCHLLSDLPRASDDVERWMRRIWGK